MKIFQKGRVESLKKWNITKYLLYAIGEILIIVIGIFVALKFDEASLENKNKKYINKVLENVNEEAQKYIQVSAFYINLNAQTDSVAYQILNDELTLADYWNDRDTQKFDLGTVTQSS